jgi:signal transduction histidine kinase
VKTIETDLLPSPLRLVRIGALTLDNQRKMTWADAGALELLGLEAGADLRGHRLVEWVVPEGQDDERAMRGKPPLAYLGLARKSALPLLVRLYASPQGVLSGTLVSVNEYLAEAQALARVKLRHTIESIIGGFAHEVRNPLAAILSLTEAAMLEQPTEDSTLVAIPGLVSRVESLIRNALSYSRPAAPRRELHHVTTLVDQAMALLRKRQRPIELHVDWPQSDTPPVMIDLLQCEQVLVNLLENALDAASTHVRVRTRRAQATVPAVCVEISDDGPGVPPEIAQRIFDPFFTTKAHGTGLGLAIARDLARLNGGELRHSPSPNGATFQFYLPSTIQPLRGNW